MKKKIITVVISALMVLTAIPSVNAYAGQKLYNNSTGNEGGYNYELWKDHGNTSMELKGGGNFSCSWNNIGNALFRKGKKFDCTKTYQQLGNISIDYACDYKPSGNSYLCVYGWTKSPLVEYYIVDSWGSWRPPGARSKGTIFVDGGTYDVYETTRVNQPSIEGTRTFKQYWSVRTSKRTSGTISVSKHFQEWEKKGMRLGKLYEAALNIEGYQSSGKASVYKNIFTVGGAISNQGTSTTPNNPSTGGGNNNQNNPSYNTGNKKECENMQLGGQYVGKINNPFSGVALYANNDSCKFTQYFSQGNHNFTLRGCSNNSKMAKVDLKIDGQYRGTFYYGGSYPTEYTIQNGTWLSAGNHQVELVVTSDDGQWDAYVDYLKWN